MNVELLTLVDRMQVMLSGFISLLPDIVFALLVFAIFFFVARIINKVVRNLTHEHHQARNLGMILE